MISPFLFILTLILAILAIGLKGTVIVEKNEEAVIERLGNFDRVIGEGVHLLIPFIENLHGIEDPSDHKKFLRNKKISLEPATFEFPKDGREFFCKDKSGFKIKADIVYQITDPYKAVYEVAYLFDAINQLFAGIIQKNLVEATGDTDSFENLQNFCTDIVNKANEYTTNWGVKILEFNLKQIIESNGIRHNL